jgi:hypothetical protein
MKQYLEAVYYETVPEGTVVTNNTTIRGHQECREDDGIRRLGSSVATQSLYTTS